MATKEMSIKWGFKAAIIMLKIYPRSNLSSKRTYLKDGSIQLYLPPDSNIF